MNPKRSHLVTHALEPTSNPIETRHAGETIAISSDPESEDEDEETDDAKWDAEAECEAEVCKGGGGSGGAV